MEGPPVVAAVQRNTGSGYLAEPQTPLARRLRHLREHQGWTRAEMAARLGSQPNRVTDWEIGLNTPTLATLTRYALLFDMTVAEILDGVM